MRKEQNRKMFNDVAPSYDKLNHTLSLNIDKMWRRKALKEIGSEEEDPSILDLACGTGDFSIAIAKAFPDARVIGVDLSDGMLTVMREKVAFSKLDDRISMETGDGENLRFEDDSFDRVTNAFGIRNFEDKAKGLEEALRVLKPGGKLVILELSRPESKFLRWLYDLYFMNILPKVGGRVSGNKAAYSYLPASVKGFPGKEEFSAMLADAGFENVTHKALTFGTCRLYTGEKPNN